MAQVIIIEDNEALLELLTLNLTTYANAQVIPRKNAAEAISLLSILPTVAIVISRDRVGDENSAEVMLEYLRQNHQETALIVTGTAPKHKDKELVNIANPNDWEATVKTCCKVLGISPDHLEQVPSPEYFAVNLSNFYLIDRTPCEVFIRIKKSAQDFQYVKRFHGGDVFSKQVIKRYEDQGLKHFHIHKDFLKNFANFVSDHLVTRLDNVELDSQDLIEVMGGSFDYVSKEILRIGFTSATLQLTESIIHKMVETVEERSPEMSELLFRVINAKSSYLYQHAHLTSVMSSECLKELGVGKKESYLKLAYASFFQNIALLDRDDLAKISSYEELEAARLSEENWDLVFHHALDAAQLITKNPEAPLGVDEIIKCHHGSLNGKGFGRADLDSLPGLTRIFVLSAEFAKHFLDYRDQRAQGQKLIPIVKILSDKYSSPEAAKVIKVIDQVLQKKKITHA